mmetsp:Transcript_24552/g.61951  ORF Transcript_24552/g.61951 Transcript_24552/m.61951 type:complete len:264 (-) Transcript_24552:230-1021(-)
MGAAVGEGGHAGCGVDGVAEDAEARVADADDACAEGSRIDADFELRHATVGALDGGGGDGHADGGVHGVVGVRRAVGGDREVEVVERLHLGHRPSLRLPRVHAVVQPRKHLVEPQNRRLGPVLGHQVVKVGNVDKHDARLLHHVSNHGLPLLQPRRYRRRDERVQQPLLQPHLPPQPLEEVPKVPELGPEEASGDGEGEQDGGGGDEVVDDREDDRVPLALRLTRQAELQQRGVRQQRHEQHHQQVEHRDAEVLAPSAPRLAA